MKRLRTASVTMADSVVYVILIIVCLQLLSSCDDNANKSKLDFSPPILLNTNQLHIECKIVFQDDEKIDINIVSNDAYRWNAGSDPKIVLLQFNSPEVYTSSTIPFNYDNTQSYENSLSLHNLSNYIDHNYLAMIDTNIVGAYLNISEMKINSFAQIKSVVPGLMGNNKYRLKYNVTTSIVPNEIKLTNCSSALLDDSYVLEIYKPNRYIFIKDDSHPFWHLYNNSYESLTVPNQFEYFLVIDTEVDEF